MINPLELMERKVAEFLQGTIALKDYNILHGQTGEDKHLQAVIVYAESMDVPSDMPYDAGNYVVKLTVHVITSAYDQNDIYTEGVKIHQDAVNSVLHRLQMVYELKQEFDEPTEGILYDLVFGGQDSGRDGNSAFANPFRFEAFYCLPPA